MVKIPEPSFADAYSGVAMVSCAWVIMAYIFMPLGPLATVKKCSAGQQKWYAKKHSIIARAEPLLESRGELRTRLY